ncbi:MAG: multi-sensor hybrid histidine kinase [Chloroflexi bacterium CSP1-4]|nr:MAG: multi-sensor hybrid histidine kinase [Chloroflexi bacterium CSP1-4]
MVGVVVLAGWALDIPLARSVVPGTISMKANTAVSFVLAGMGLWLVTGGRAGQRAYLAGRLLGLAVAAAGILNLGEYAFGVDLGIDQLLFIDHDAATAYPGRMSLLTALAFMAAGTALAFIDARPRGRWPAGLMAIVAGGVGYVALVGYALGVDVVGVVTLQNVAINTGVTLLVVSFGILATRPERGLGRLLYGTGPGSLLFRRLLPVAIVVTPAFAVLRLAGQRAGLYSTETGTAIFTLAMIAAFFATLLWSARSLDAIDAARRETLARLDRFFAISQDMLVITDAEGRFAKVSEASRRIVGRTPDELVGRPFLDFVHPDDRERTVEEFRLQIAEGRTTFAFVNRYLHTDGGVRSIEWTSRYDADDGFVYAVARDVTERQQAERWAAELFDSFAAPVAIFEPVRDETGEVIDFRRVYANPRTAEILRRPMAEVVGGSLRKTTLPGNLDIGFQAFRRVLETGERQLLPDLDVSDPTTGRSILFAVHVSRSGGRVAMVSRDVTLERTAEREIHAAREEAEAANRAKTEFLSRMSHELRTPLNAIIGFAQILELDGLDERQAESVDQILKGGRHLLELINEVLDISRIESGQLTMSVEPVLVRDAVSEAISLIGPLADERRIRLRSTITDDGLWALADRQRLKQVLLNLLVNAVKYGRADGTAVLSCSRTDGGRLRFTVADDGPGIALELQERLFAPFERLGADASTVEGTGLGLALSRALIVGMGGTMGMDSSPGEGTTFWFELPQAEAAEERAPEVGATASVKGTGRSGTVLYIEDNLSNVRLIERALERLGDVRLLPAMLGRLGLELAREHRPDVILLDLHLPDIAGEEVLARLVAEPATRRIPVVVLSADASSSQADRLLASGARAYLTKPIDVLAFLDLVGELLGGAGTDPEAEASDAAD